MPPPAITVTKPGGGEDWQKGSQQTIQWTSQNLTGNVGIELFKGKLKVATIAGNTADDGSFSWTVPSDKAAANDYRIKVTSLAYAVSDFGSFFTISNPPSIIQVTSPAGGENWPKNTTQTIAWRSQNVTGNVQIVLVRSGSVYHPIASKPASDGRYSWAIPDYPAWDPASNYRVHIGNQAGTVWGLSGPFILSPAPFDHGHPAHRRRRLAERHPAHHPVDVPERRLRRDQDRALQRQQPGGDDRPSDLERRQLHLDCTHRPGDGQRLPDQGLGAGWRGRFQRLLHYLRSSEPHGDLSRCWRRLAEEHRPDHRLDVAEPPCRRQSEDRALQGRVLAATVATSAPNAGSYSWAIPNDPTWHPGNDDQVKVSNLAGTVSDYSGLFSLSSPPAITVTEPDGGENWQKGSPHAIQCAS